MTTPPEIERFLVENITVPSSRRAVDKEAVKTLAASITKIGLRTPITVRVVDEGADLILIAGAHRLAAVKELGWEKIDCIVLDCDETQAELWEIAENLHRAELSVIERAEQIARWVELSNRIPAQLGQVSKGGRGKESGHAKAARELGIDRKEVQRSASISKLSDAAKAAAVELKVDDNQSILLAAAKVTLEQQEQAIRAAAAKRKNPSAFPEDDAERSIKWRRAFERTWNDAPSQADREWATDWIDRPIMDAA